MNFINNKSAKIKSIVKDYFLAGLFILAPMMIVGVAFQWVFGGILGWIERNPLHWFFNNEPSDLAGIVRFLLVLGTLLSFVLITSIVGFLSRLYFGKRAFIWIKESIERIPLFGPIYSSVDQLFSAISSSGGKQFSRVVYVEYPRKNVWAVAFVTGDADLKGIPPGFLSVYVPTVPNPTSGFHLMVSSSEVIESGLKVDEAFKLILSLGVAMPHYELPHET